MTEHLVYGLHAVKALLRNPHRPVKALYVNFDRTDQKMQAILDAAVQRNIPVEKMSAQVMNQRFSGFTHQGVVAAAGVLPEFGEADLTALLTSARQPPLILILDGITDPHNLGACLRTADAAGVDFVIIPRDKSAGMTPVVSKVACGAAESVPLVRVTNLVRAMENLKQQGVWIYGAAGEASQTLYQLDCRSSLALVMGAEGSGMRRLTREHCDGLFALPMLGSVDSLNVSVATGASLYEVVRQRRSG
ncbi:23S rRNA (guanosine(2251)-2'-O)-methyltransferase RlmB [Legionella spiritensis]|uniref:23S rRNA (guanosine-2'-O-)-methyltransferase RlmB n=1 Tax=Legionella spiritensis TaxID=452 RepID=A0A0W0ZB33_LEGSP|nr:23S rRNA (guanosine(2251)-2'-O)-methyltransferase RlmB [Legionella spiritensis]KTD66311.1 tRNA/rRNA methyltransferase [Legionella spiritensis]SNV48592.1 tRNA/rRNA methyltransferase [Legionella spiritensis]